MSASTLAAAAASACLVSFSMAEDPCQGATVSLHEAFLISPPRIQHESNLDVVSGGTPSPGAICNVRVTATGGAFMAPFQVRRVWAQAYAARVMTFSANIPLEWEALAVGMGDVYADVDVGLGLTTGAQASAHSLMRAVAPKLGIDTASEYAVSVGDLTTGQITMQLGGNMGPNGPSYGSTLGVTVQPPGSGPVGGFIAICQPGYNPSETTVQLSLYAASRTDAMVRGLGGLLFPPSASARTSQCRWDSGQGVTEIRVYCPADGSPVYHWVWQGP